MSSITKGIVQLRRQDVFDWRVASIVCHEDGSTKEGTINGTFVTQYDAVEYVQNQFSYALLTPLEWAFTDYNTKYEIDMLDDMEVVVSWDWTTGVNFVFRKVGGNNVDLLQLVNDICSF